ncbi:SpoIIE family protein phosphatase [Streptomyces sp. SCA3-4]|uniref:SpoIIE family protein phosphatase n=1 Tax=Streptomyces sichuanensis TaxID=2871810 RepID=UPI001CE2362A|nr:SpoIIE family protein phosphatase [Streptomyces sichuanensis]MCA6091192.1 SpoIIE family protein phosphatase [Streptomyces sichuanensis]
MVTPRQPERSEQRSNAAPDDERARPGGPDGPAGGGGPGGSGGTASALGRLADTVDRLRREVREAHAAADGRALIEMAKGILVERLRCGPVQADRQLASLSARAGVTRLELAADIISQAAHDRLAEVTASFIADVGAVPPAADGTAGRTAGGTAGGTTARATGRGATAVPSVAVRLRTAESGALAADDTQAVAESLLAHALAPLGAVAVAVWAARTDASLALAGCAGLPAEEAARWHYVPPAVATPARRALTERRQVSFPVLKDACLPSVGHRELPDGGRVAVPAEAGGRILGVLEICWPRPLPSQSPQIRRQLEALAELCAHTLEHSSPAAAGPCPALQPCAAGGVGELVDLADGIRDPALVLLPALDAHGRLGDFRIHHVNRHFVDPLGRPAGAVTGALLLEAYPMAAGHEGLFHTIERVHATGEPFRAERITLTTVVDHQIPVTSLADISISRHGTCLLLVWRVEDEAVRLANLLQHAQRLGRIGGFEESTTTGEITWNQQLFSFYGLPSTARPVPLEQLPAFAHPDDSATIGRFLRTLLHHRRPASTDFRLRRPDGIARHIRIVGEPVLDAAGRLLAVRGAYQDISAQHWTEVALAATRDQLAHTEQQAAERNRLTLQLQHAIMPPARGPMDTPHLHIAVRYRPAEKDHLVGGDWYDVATLPTGQTLLCVGDVAGHGIDAATDMVVLRNALRGLAATGAGPAQLLAWLNVVTFHLTERVTATAVCGLYDPASRVLSWARAGHLPPVLIRRGHADALPLIKGLLLGAVPETRYEESRLQLEPEDVLLMYTDGLIECKDRSLHDAQRQLLTTGDCSTDTLEQRLDKLLSRSSADTDDDTCVIGMQLR